MLDDGYKSWVLTISRISNTKSMAQSYCKVNIIIHVMGEGGEKQQLIKIYIGSRSYTSKEKYEVLLVLMLEKRKLYK
jgi:hypothetical protein